MKQLVSVNLTTRTATDWTPPELFFGETLTLALRFSKTTQGQDIDAALTVSSLKAAIGLVDARPTGGQFAIKIGSAASDNTNTTAALDFNTSAANMQALLNAVAAHAAYGAARVVFSSDSWLIFFGDQSAEVPLTVVNNGLWPVSFGRINAWQIDGKWVHELRLTQAPVAFTSGLDSTLPPAPAITRIQAGGADSTMTWNEIQQLYVPPEFLGSYILTRGYGKTQQLSNQDGIDVIQQALDAAFGANNFTVTLPLSNKPTIEFVGDFSGLSEDLLVAQVQQAPGPDIAFTLTLDRAELAAMLRSQTAVTLPLEIRVSGTDDSGFSGELVAFSLDITIKAPTIFADIEERPVTDWLRPVSPKTYVPFGGDNILTGQHYYRHLVGDGMATAFAVAHGLASEDVFVVVRENHSGGRQLVDGTDYSATIDSDSQVTVTALTGAPATNAWAVIVVSAQSVAAWASDLTVTVPQVVAGGGYPSLSDFMDDIGSRVTTLEGILPSTGPAATTSQASGITIALPTTQEVLFFRGDATKLFGADGVDPTQLGRAPMMLPAIHAATPTSYTTGDLPAVAAGSLWQNNSGATLDFGRGVYGGKVPIGGFFASDGRALFAVDHSGSTTSYFPTGFDRELWRLFINDKMLRVNRTLDVQFGLALQLAAATSNAQWMLVVEKGTAPSETTPATPATNLQNIVWDATPILSQRLILTGLRQTHSFGARIKRTVVSMADTFTLDTLLYGVWEGNNSAAPSSANFALRARLIQFDTENALASDARGWIASEIIGPADGGKPQAIIQ